MNRGYGPNSRMCDTGISNFNFISLVYFSHFKILIFYANTIAGPVNDDGPVRMTPTCNSNSN
jgi:hypothetical protein